ncbi:MAG: hypothetical protein Q9187_004541 [Circinaria calcarea]
MPPLETKFPKFPDGDVMIVLSGGRVYRLHASILRHSSDLFACLLPEEHGATLSSKAKKDGATIRYRLDWVADDTEIGHFVHRDIEAASGVDLENGKVTKPAFLFFDNLFRALYNIALEINTENLATILRDCMGLIGTAEGYGAIAVVRESIDIALLRQGQVLFKSIATNPVAWINLSFRIQSPTIFKDALIHLVGQWMMLSDEKKELLSVDLLPIVERKFNEFQMVKQAREIRIVSHYPDSVQKDAGSNPGRNDYANDVYSWMGIALARHYVATQVTEKANKDAKDGGWAFYVRLSRGGETYLNQTQRANFHEFCPMSKKGQTVFDNHLNVIKEDIQKLVAPLLVNNTQLEIREGDRTIKHLLSLDVDKEDYPWATEGGIGVEAVCGGRGDMQMAEGSEGEKSD